MQPRASGTAVRPVVGLSFIQVRLRSAPGPLGGFPERGHPFGLATDGEPAQDEVEGGRAHGLRGGPRRGRGGGRPGCLRLAAPGPCCHHEPSPHCRPGGACVQKRRDVSTCTWTSRITCARSILAPAVSRPRTPGCCHLTDPLLRRPVCAAGQPANTQVSRCITLSESDREFPALTGRSGTQRARPLLRRFR